MLPPPDTLSALRGRHPANPSPSAPARSLILARFVVLHLFLPVSLHAQSATTGAIAGRVPRAPFSVISARDNETAIETHIRSSRSGIFLLPHLTPGDYDVTIATPGLPDDRFDHITVTLGIVTQLFPQPELPNSPALDLASFLSPRSSPAAPFDLPANPDSDSAEESLPTFRGLPATQNALRLDGGDTTQSFGSVPIGSGSPIDQPDADTSDDTPDTGATSRSAASSRSIRGASAPFIFAHAAIREFHLTGQTYSALYGSAPGGILTAVTRSGGQQLHGSVFLVARNSAFAATNPYAIATTYTSGAIASAAVKPQDSRQQFGGSLGGPLLPRRLFFFAAVDAQRRDFPAISSPQNPSFYTLTPTQRALLANRGVSTTAINTALNYLSSLTGPTPRRADGEVVFARLDHHAARLHTSFEYNRAHWSQPAGALSAPVVSRARASIGNTATSVDTLLARATLTLTPTITNEFHIQYGRDLQSQSPQTPLPQEPAIGPNGLPPEVSIGPQGLTFGTPAALGRAAYPDERRLQFIDLLSWVHGRNHLQFGFDISRVHTFVDALANQQGTFLYDSALTTPGRAGGLVDWITDATFNVNAYPNGACPSINAPIHLFCFRSFTQSFGSQTVAFDTQEYAGYLQNDLTLTPTLTLHTGIRYDYQLLPIPQQPNQTLDVIFLAQAATSIFPEDRNNIAPRIALAWQPLERLTLRAGYGLYFGRLPGATIRAALLNTDLPTSTTHIRILPSTITNCPQVQNQGFGYPCAYLASPAAALPTTASAALFSRRFRLPAVQQASLTAEAELPGNILATATYRLNIDRQLPSSVDLNIAPSTTTATYQLQGGTGAPGVQDGETFVLPLYTARLTPTAGPVTAITSSANATYHGLTVEARRRARSLTFNTSFTWSKAIDFAPTQGAIPRANAQLDPFNLRYDKGLSTLNFPFRFVADVTWRPTLVTPSRTLRALANGWSIVPVFLRRSGAPYSLTLSGGTRLSGGSESLNGSGGALYLPTVGRNTLRLPPATTFDLRVARAIRLREHLRLRASAEAYNLANHVNLAGVTTRAYLLGTPASGITPLIFQNAAAIAAEAVTARPFGAFTDSGTSDSRARALQFSIQLDF